MYFVLGIILGVILLGLLIWLIVWQMTEHYNQYEPKLFELREKFREFPGVNNIKLYKGNKSYTINKAKVYLCLRDKNGHYYNDNLLAYVFLHELAHVISDSVGHNEEFHHNFDKLLDMASERGLYNPAIPIDTNYCNFD